MALQLGNATKAAKALEGLNAYKRSGARSILQHKPGSIWLPGDPMTPYNCGVYNPASKTQSSNRRILLRRVYNYLGGLHRLISSFAATKKRTKAPDNFVM
jgi:hypothetical protein